MKNLRISHLGTILACGLMVSCAGRQMSFTSLEPGSTISVVPLDNPDGKVQTVPNPFSTNSAKLQNKAIRISANGKAPQYWFPPDDSAHRLDVKIRNLPSCTQAEVGRNRPLRFLLKAYQALTEKDFTLARELCTQAGQLDPTLAAPFIITGLTYFQEGRRPEARVAFNKARSLDPEDQEIGELLRMVQ